MLLVSFLRSLVALPCLTTSSARLQSQMAMSGHLLHGPALTHACELPWKYAGLQTAVDLIVRIAGVLHVLLRMLLHMKLRCSWSGVAQHLG